MMSPIAIASAKASMGEPVKGSGRRSNGPAQRPPILTLIENASSIEALAGVRGALIFGLEQGTMAPSDKTEHAWDRAFWKRLLELILSCNEETACPTYIYNYCLRWEKPVGVQEAIEAAVEAMSAVIPSQVERWRKQGITVEGVTK